MKNVMEMIEIRCDIQSGVHATIVSTCLYVWNFSNKTILGNQSSTSSVPMKSTEELEGPEKSFQ